VKPGAFYAILSTDDGEISNVNNSKKRKKELSLK
jgi:hypothetical protein